VTLNSVSNLLLNLFLDNDRQWDKDEIDKMRWLISKGPEFKEVANDNRVLLRGLEKLIPLVETVSWREESNFITYLKDNQKSEMTRVSKSIALAYSVQNTFEEEGIKSVAFKTMDNFPDLGRDLDLLIPDKEHFAKAKKIMSRDFGWKPADKLSFCDTVVGKTFYTKEEDYDISVELYPRHSQLGEEYMSDVNIVERRIKENTGGYDFFVPSNEDKLLIQAIHRIYRHAVLRISDIVNVCNWANSRKIDWRKVMVDAKNSGAVSGLILFLGTIDFIYQQTCGHHLPLPTLFQGKTFELQYSSKLVQREFPAKMPYFSTASVILRKIGDDVSRGKVRSASKVATMPILIGMTFITYNFFGRNYIW